MTKGSVPNAYQVDLRSQGIIPLNNWTYIVSVFNDSGMYIYINGVLDTFNNEDMGPLNYQEVNSYRYIGGTPPQGLYFFNGLMDEIRFSNYSKSQQEIMEEYLRLTYPESAQVPEPTNHSLIVSSTDIKDVLACSSVESPVIISGSITPQISRFLLEYRPDHIYLVGNVDGDVLEDAGWNYSRISGERVPELFFPNASRAVFVNVSRRWEAILGSQIAVFLRAPVVLEGVSGFSEIIGTEDMNASEISGLYLGMVTYSGDNVDYLVLADLDSEEALLAGRLSGMRGGLVVPVEGKSFEGIRKTINETIDLLGFKGMYHKNVRYKKGEPVYLAILGGNESVPFVRLFDPGLEIFDNRDGWWIYSDLGYSDSNGDGFFDLAEGRMEGGLEAVSLHMAREFLPKNQSAVLIGEYRHPKFEDLKFFGGGMTQTFTGQVLLEQANLSVKRIVEQRMSLEGAENTTAAELYKKYKDWFERSCMKILLQVAGKVWAFAEYGSMAMYAFLEFDWAEWEHLGGAIPVPEHLEVVGGDIAQKIGSPGIVGFFGVGDEGWTIPKQNRDYWDLVFWPYRAGSIFDNLTFSGFLYDDHDMSANSSIKDGVLKEGGGVLGSSGIVHDPYAIHTSTLFFRSLVYGKPLGQAFIESANIDPLQGTLGFMFLNFVYSKFGQTGEVMVYPFLYAKDKYERILFSDPAVSPVRKVLRPKKFVYSATAYNSFKVEAFIESNYTAFNDTIDVWNVDDYLLENGKPITPILIREFMLPENSAVNWVNVSGIYSLRRLSPVFVVNDSYYSNWTQITEFCINSSGFSGLTELNGEQEGVVLGCIGDMVSQNVRYPYPNSTFWWSSHNLLDNRILVYVFVPAVLQENGTFAQVLENASVQVDYEAGMEMSVVAADVLLGEDAIVKVDLMNQGQEASGKVWIFVEGEDFFEFSDWVTVPGSSSMMKEFSFTPSLGEYEVTAVFEGENGIGPRHAYFSVEVPVAVPELNESERGFLIKPGKSHKADIPLGNSGNAALEMFAACEGFSGILCETTGQVIVNPGEWEDFSINISVPGGHPANEYYGKIVLTGNGISRPETKEIPVKVLVPEAVYWSLSPLEWVCAFPGCGRDFLVKNSRESNGILHADISLEGIDLLLVQDDLSADPGEEKNLSVFEKIPQGGLASGVFIGNITLKANPEHGEQKISVTLIAEGPKFTLDKEFQPDHVRVFWKQFSLPKINHVEIYLNNTGSVPIERINLSDEIPEGWKGKKPVLSFVKRNRKELVKDLSYSYSNGYVNLSFDFSGKPLLEGEDLEVHYLIYSQPKFVPAGDIITQVSGEARSRGNIYALNDSSADLRVEHFDPPKWLRWLYILIYRLL
jgi:hypothetical protein